MLYLAMQYRYVCSCIVLKQNKLQRKLFYMFSKINGTVPMLIIRFTAGMVLKPCVHCLSQLRNKCKYMYTVQVHRN